MDTAIYQYPNADEFAPYYGRYISVVQDDNPLELLARQTTDLQSLVGGIAESRGDYAYAPAKWTIKEVIGHMNDAERIFAYRALWIARADPAPLPGFDENAWMTDAGFRERSVRDLLAEFHAVRESSLCLFRHLDRAAAARRGVASGNGVSVQAILYIMAGHVQHHLGVLRERYGL